MSNNLTTSNNEYHVWFDSMEELDEDLKKIQLPENAVRYRHFLTRQGAGGYTPAHWLGGLSTGLEVLEKVRYGWPEMLARLQPIVAQLRTSLELDSVTPMGIEMRRRKRHRSDHGDSIDMHRVWGGQLDKAWERPIKVQRMQMTERYATLYSDLSVQHFVHTDHTLWRAAAMFCCVEVLTRMGINTEVWAGGSHSSSYIGGPSMSWNAVKIKEFTQPLNDDRLASMLSAPFLRTIGFGMMLCAPWRPAGNMGIPHNSGLVQPLRDRQAAGERVFRMGECLTFEGAKLEVQKVIETLKVSKEAA